MSHISNLHHIHAKQRATTTAPEHPGTHVSCTCKPALRVCVWPTEIPEIQININICHMKSLNTAHLCRLHPSVILQQYDQNLFTMKSQVSHSKKQTAQSRFKVHFQIIIKPFFSQCSGGGGLDFQCFLNTVDKKRIIHLCRYLTVSCNLSNLKYLWCSLSNQICWICYNPKKCGSINQFPDIFYHVYELYLLYSRFFCFGLNAVKSG